MAPEDASAASAFNYFIFEANDFLPLLTPNCPWRISEGIQKAKNARKDNFALSEIELTDP
jgi:hypothetical protein